MAYTTGTANDLPALLTAIRAACVAGGWALSGNTLTKGALAMQITSVAVTGAGGATGLRFLGGTGESGGAVTGAAPYASDIGTLSAFAMSYPLTYHLFVFENPDEVYCFVNYDVSYFQWAAWGGSSLTLPGTGMWFGASIYSHNRVTSPSATGYSVYAINVGPGGSFTYLQPLLFLRSDVASANGAGYAECFIHHGFDGIGWPSAIAAEAAPTACNGSSQLLALLPSAWNSESVLVPIHVSIRRPSNRRSLVATLGHSRYVRLDNHAPGEIITIGTDQWMALPFLRKDSVARNGMTGDSPVKANLHTGTLGLAIRYDGA